MPAAKDGLTPELRQKFAELKTQLGAGVALVKLSRMIPGSATAEPVMTADGKHAVHRATWDELGDLVSWVATRPGVVPGGEYIVQAYADRNGDGQPRGAPKAAGAIRIPSAVDQARQATAAQTAQVAAEAEMLRGKAAAQLAEVQRVGEEARRAMATEAEVLAAARTNPAGTDPTVIDRTMAASAEAQKRLADVMQGFQQTTFAFQQAMARQAPTAAPATATPTVQAPVVTPAPTPAGTVLVARGDGTYQLQPAPVASAQPGVVQQPIKVDGGYLANGTFYPVPTTRSERDADLAEIREQLRTAQADAKTAAETMRRQLDDEREARRAAERKADEAKAEGERKAEAAKNEAAMKELRDQMARQAEDNRRALEKLTEDNRRAMEDLKKADSGDKSDKWLPAILGANEKAADANAKHMADMMAANERASAKVIELMERAQSSDSAELLQKTIGSMMQVFTIKDQLTHSMLRQVSALQGPKSSPIIEALTKVNDSLPGILHEIAEMVTGGARGRPAADNGEAPRELPPLPAPALPPSAPTLPPASAPQPAPSLGETLVASARQHAREGRFREALQTIGVALQEDATLQRPGELAADSLRRLFGGAVPDAALRALIRMIEPAPEPPAPPPPAAEQPAPAAT